MLLYVFTALLSFTIGMLLNSIQGRPARFSKKEIEVLAWNQALMVAGNPNPRAKLFNDMPAALNNPWQAVYLRAMEMLPKAIDEIESEREIKNILLKEEKKMKHPERFYDRP